MNKRRLYETALERVVDIFIILIGCRNGALEQRACAACRIAGALRHASTHSNRRSLGAVT